jgi:hypothetical protein
MLDVSNPTKVRTLEQIVLKTKTKKLQENGSHPLVPNAGHGWSPRKLSGSKQGVVKIKLN